MRKVIPVLFLVVLGTALAVAVGCSKDDDNPTQPPPACSIDMLTPEGGQTFYTGNTVNIRWTNNGNPSTVDIRLVSGAQDTLIAAGVANTAPNGFYPWTINAYGFGRRDNYQVRVSGAGNEACWDTTNQFTIISLSGCEINFPYQVGKDSIPDQTAGDLFTIKWISERTSDTVRLELWTTSPGPAFNPQEPFFVIDPAADNTTTVDDTTFYDWTVSSFNYSENAIYRFRVTDTNLNTCGDTSIPFRIVDNAVCSITVGLPNGTVYDPGQTVRVDVVGENLPGLVDAELLASGGQVPGTIIEDHDPSQPILWPADDFGFTGTNSYRVRVISADDPFCSGVSVPIQITR